MGTGGGGDAVCGTCIGVSNSSGGGGGGGGIIGAGGGGGGLDDAVFDVFPDWRTPGGCGGGIPVVTPPHPDEDAAPGAAAPIGSNGTPLYLGLRIPYFSGSFCIESLYLVASFR